MLQKRDDRNVASLVIEFVTIETIERKKKNKIKIIYRTIILSEK